MERHYFLPCPHCGEYIELKFAQIKVAAGQRGRHDGCRPRRVRVLRARRAARFLNDAEKMEMPERGEWRDVRKTARVARSVAFWMNTLYSPFTRFSEIAKAFMAAKDDPEALQQLHQPHGFAEPWEDTKLKTSAELVSGPADRASRSSPYRTGRSC